MKWQQRLRNINSLFLRNSKCCGWRERERERERERIKLWKQQRDEPITRIISKQLDIKLGPFTQGELDSVLRKIKNRKAAGLDEIPPEVWKTRQFDDILLRHCNAVYNQNPIDRWTKGCILPFPKKGDLGLAKNYRGITLTSIAAKIYNALLRNRIEPKIDNILRKNQNGFRRNRSTTSQILTIRRILEGVRAKNLQATLIFVDFTKAFDSIHRGKRTNPTRERPIDSPCYDWHHVDIYIYLEPSFFTGGLIKCLLLSSGAAPFQGYQPERITCLYCGLSTLTGPWGWKLPLYIFWRPHIFLPA